MDWRDDLEDIQRAMADVTEEDLREFLERNLSNAVTVGPSTIQFEFRLS
jgi:archaellum biogenesis protein FlaJ (TadC family)